MSDPPLAFLQDERIEEVSKIYFIFIVCYQRVLLNKFICGFMVLPVALLQEERT